MKRIRNRIIAVLLSLILVSITVIPQSQPKEVKAEMALPFLAGGALTLGEMAYGVLVGAGITAVTPDLVNDVFFQDRYSINSMIERGILTPVPGGNAEDLNDYNWDNVIQEIEEKTDSGESKFFKNAVKPIFSNYQPPSGGDPDWKKKLREWYIILGTTASLNASLYGGMLQPLSTAIQQWAQPQVEVSVPASFYEDVSAIDFSAINNLVQFDCSHYALAATPYWSTKTSYSLVPLPENAIAFGASNYDVGFYVVSSEPFVTKFCQPQNNNIASWDLSVTANSGLYTGFYGYNATALDSSTYFGVVGDYDDYLNFLKNPDFSQYNTTPRAPDLVNQDGNVYNITNINPIIQPNQTMQVPTKDLINNYINNYYNTTNQGDVINNYNDFINNLIQETPVSTPSPIPIPTTQPLPDLTPLPTPDPEDENSKYLAPNLKDYFPFCIPWDIADIFQNFTAERKAPKFVFPLKSERFGIDEEIVVDLSQFDDVAAILRALELILFVIGLAVATRALIGALS